MAHVSSKNLIPMCILQILKEYSDENHPLTQEKIGYYLSQNYDITQERKAIGRSISKMVDELDIDIQSDKRGSWLASREFEDAELRMIIDLLMASRFISEADSKDLVKRLCTLSSKYFEAHIRHVITANPEKTSNRELFLNLEMLGEAIGKKQVVEFRYLDPALDYDKDGCQSRNYVRVSPYKIGIHNQRYYLIGHEEDYCVYCRLDDWKLNLIRELRVLDRTDQEYTPLETLNLKEKDAEEYFAKILASPQLVATDIISGTFIVSRFMLERVQDAFGKDIIERNEEPANRRGIYNEDGIVRVTVKSTFFALKVFALSYIGCVRVISPESLRLEVEEILKKGANNYKLQDEQKRYTIEERNALKKISFRDRIRLNLPILLGRYPQTTDGTWDPVEWLVLDHDEETALLMSRYILDAAPYYEDTEDDTSRMYGSLRKCLSNIQSKNRITDILKLKPVHPEEDNDIYSVLTWEKRRKYFKSTLQLEAEPTDYMKNKYRGDWKYEDALSGCWWLKDVTENGEYAAYVDMFGIVVPPDTMSVYSILGVRPVIRIDLSEFEEDLEF